MGSNRHTLSLTLVSILLYGAPLWGFQGAHKAGFYWDVDDTVRVMNIGGNPNYFQAALNLFYQSNAFVGMPELVDFLHKNTTHADTRFISNVPDIFPLPQMSRKFLDQFAPYAELMKRDSLYTDKVLHKLSAIVESAEKDPNRPIYLFGDNGELDPLIFHLAKVILGDQVKAMFIHQIYRENGAKLYEGQIPFFTSAELATHLYEEKLISRRQMVEVMVKVRNHLNKTAPGSDSYVFPSFSDIDHETTRRLHRISQKLGPVAKKLLSEITMHVGQSIGVRCRTTFSLDVLSS